MTLRQPIEAAETSVATDLGMISRAAHGLVTSVPDTGRRPTKTKRAEHVQATTAATDAAPTPRAALAVLEI